MSRQAIVGIVISVASLSLVAPAGASPKKTKFVSKRYHYSLLLPGGSSSWLNSHAIVNWSGVYPPSLNNPGFDHLADMREGGGVWLIAAKPVPQGMTLAKWTAYTIAKRNPNCTPLPWHSMAKLGGAPARRYDVSCSEGRVIDVTALHAHRGYFFICIPGTTKRLAAQRACSTVQRSFHFVNR